jgi:deoxyribodipyrimidine photo-lyase
LGKINPGMGPKPLEAYQTFFISTRKYGLDGRDPCGFTGVVWCFGKYDRAWKEREIFGKVRGMNSYDLRRKFKIERYLEKVEDMSG